MPTPGFPIWLGPGAIVVPGAHARTSGVAVRYVVMGIELVLPGTPWGDDLQPSLGLHSIALAPLLEGGERRVDGQGLFTVNLSAFLDLYVWVGEYLSPDGSITGVGTTMPVSMHMAAIRDGELAIVEGSIDRDGLYEMIAPVTGQIILQPRPITREAVASRPADSVIFDDPEMGPETDQPRVRDGQIWLLPAPNRGRWRTTINPNIHPPVELRHTVEETVMRCPATWLIEHGVRQDPPDPRQAGPGQVVARGQVWDLPARGPRPRGRFRVMEINGVADRVRLQAEDGSGKRLYLRPSQIVAEGTFLGDGLPRRTAFERILEADDNE